MAMARARARVKTKSGGEGKAAGEAEAVVKLEEQVDKALEEVRPPSSLVTALALEGSAREL